MTDNIMQQLYDSEINCSVSCFWDGGWTWKLGDNANGWTADGAASTWEEAMEGLAAAAVAQYPRSSFAATYEPVEETK